MPALQSVPKFIGTVSLGLLTGISYTLTTLSYPTLLHLPSASHCADTFSHLRSSASNHIRSLSALSTIAMGSAYLLSPKSAKHPYLLWTAVLALGTNASEIYAGVVKMVNKSETQEQGQQDFNGEKVQEEVVLAQRREGVRALTAGLGFVVGVVGIWGDWA